MTQSSSAGPATRAMEDIASIDEVLFKELIKSLNAEPIPKSEAEIEERVQSEIPSLSKEVIKAIVGFSIAFSGAISQTNNESQFLKSLANRAKQGLGEENVNDLEDRLRLLFSSSSIAFTGRGRVAHRENLNVVVRSYINTDLRPISLPESGKVENFSVLHRLRFDFVNDLGSDSKGNIELVLDHEDLRELNDRIERALATQTSLQSTVFQIGGSIFMPYEEKEANNE